MAKRKITFEGIVPEWLANKTMGLEYGFVWSGVLAAETSHPFYAHVPPGSGTAVGVMPFSGLSGFGALAGPDNEFKLRKAKIIDINGDDWLDNIVARGFRDGQLVAEEAFFFSSNGPETIRFSRDFRDIDNITFSSNSNTWAIDDILVRLPNAPAPATDDLL